MEIKQNCCDVTNVNNLSKKFKLIWQPGIVEIFDILPPDVVTVFVSNLVFIDSWHFKDEVTDKLFQKDLEACGNFVGLWQILETLGKFRILKKLLPLFEWFLVAFNKTQPIIT